MKGPSVGDIGTVVEVTVTEDGTAIDISGATTKTMRFRRGDGTILDVTASFSTDGTDGKIQYAMLSGNLNSAGVWEVQGKAAAASWTYYTGIGQFMVEDVLPAA